LKQSLLELAEKPEEEHDGFEVDWELELHWNWYQGVREHKSNWNEWRAATTGQGIIRKFAECKELMQKKNSLPRQAPLLY
jgi:hypothetical protein